MLDRRDTSTLQIIVFLVDIFTSARQLFDVTWRIVENFFDVTTWIPKFLIWTFHKTPNRLEREPDFNMLKLKDVTERSDLLENDLNQAANQAESDELMEKINQVTEKSDQLEHDRNQAANHSTPDLDEVKRTLSKLQADSDELTDKLKKANEKLDQLEHDRIQAAKQSALDLDEVKRTLSKLQAERDQLRGEHDQLLNTK